MPVTIQGVAILLLVAFGPPALFAMVIARAKRYRREPGHAVRGAFLWGALGAAGIALIVNGLAAGQIVRPYLRHEGLVEVALAVAVAPIVEETAKPLVLFMGAVRRHTDEAVDGLIYGAVAGLGFSATENLFYELSALATSGQAGYVTTAVLRTFSSTLLHATATAMTGYGIARWFTGRNVAIVVPFYLAAVLLHAAFNFVATFALVFGVLPLIALSITGFLLVRSHIERLSLVAPHDRWDPVGPGRLVPSKPPGDAAAPSWRVVDERPRGPLDWNPRRPR